MPVKKKRSEIDERAFTRFLSSLHPDTEQAGHAYKKLVDRLQKFFASRGLGARDAELADEVLNRVTRKFENEGKLAGDTVSYALGVARFVAKEQTRRAPPEPLPSDLPSTPYPDLAFEQENARKDRCLMKCLTRLSESDYYLISKYYGADRNGRTEVLLKIARTANISEGAVRTRLCRLLRQLRRDMLKCMAPPKVVMTGEKLPDHGEPQ